MCSWTIFCIQRHHLMVWRVIRLGVVVDWITARVRFVSVVRTKARQIDRDIKLQTRILGANSCTLTPSMWSQRSIVVSNVYPMNSYNNCSYSGDRHSTHQYSSDSTSTALKS